MKRERYKETKSAECVCVCLFFVFWQGVNFMFFVFGKGDISRSRQTLMSLVLVLPSTAKVCLGIQRLNIYFYHHSCSCPNEHTRVAP